MNLSTTLNKIKSKQPCISGWTTLLKSLNKTLSDDNPIDLIYILKSNGIEDAVWCLRCFNYKEYCLFLADIAESVLPIYEKEYPDNIFVRDCIKSIRKYYAGEITKKELDAAAYAAESAAYATTTAAIAATATVSATTTTAAATTTTIARELKWQEIEQLFIKHFSIN
jgi:hypothetical protein